MSTNIMEAVKANPLQKRTFDSRTDLEQIFREILRQVK